MFHLSRMVYNVSFENDSKLFEIPTWFAYGDISYISRKTVLVCVKSTSGTCFYENFARTFVEICRLHLNRRKEIKLYLLSGSLLPS